MLKNRRLESTYSKQKKKNKSPLRVLNTSISTQSSSVSIDPPKGCLRFFSKNPYFNNPKLKTNPISKPISRSSNTSKENVSQNSLRKIGEISVKKPELENGSKRMSSSCSMKVPRVKNKNFTPAVMDYKSGNPRLLIKKHKPGIDDVEKLASGSVFESKWDRPCSGAASSRCSKENPKKKQIELGNDPVEKSTLFTNSDSGISLVEKLASGSVFESKFDKPHSRAASSRSSKEDRKKKQIMGDELGNGLVEKSGLFTNPDSGIGLVEKLASGSVFESKFDKPDSKVASSKFFKENLKKKQIACNKLGTDLVEESTPINNIDRTETAVATSSSTNTTTTPPVQASVSPDLNCVSSSSVLAASAAKTPTCYGAGHLVSGVTDRRKCRARGLLTVGQKDSCSSDLKVTEKSDDLGTVSKSRLSLIPFPAEASMHWILSPCEEVDEDQRTNHSSGNRNLSDLCIFDSSSSASPSSARQSKIVLLSPNRSPAMEGIFGASSGKVESSSASPNRELVVQKEVRKNRYDMNIESSAFSGDSLGSGNVIRTPQSELSSDRIVGLSCSNQSENKIYDFGYDIDCATDDLSGASLSPKINRSIWDSPGFGFHLPEIVSPSNSKSSDISSSHLRVSWRDGLHSRIYEMDESEICRCLSDDENDGNKSSNGKNKSSLSELNDDMYESGKCDDKFVSLASKYEGEREEKIDEKRANPCEESISTDGGGLAASGDSDWTSCYKNQLFQL